jgi:hypothetical protein
MLFKNVIFENQGTLGASVFFPKYLSLKEQEVILQNNFRKTYGIH